jgi:hypothetical protein
MTSPIGYGGPQGGGDSGGEFESYRQKRQSRRFKSTGGVPSSVLDAKSKLQRAIEDEERREMVERQLAREVQEFVEETTRLAASILNQVASQEDQQQEERIGSEMKEFFQATLHRAESMLMSLRSMENDGTSVADLEATLKNLSTQTLDEFRSEGTESLRDAHMGQDPGLASISPVEDPEAPAAGALSLISKEAGWQEITDPAEEEEAEEKLVEEFGEESTETIFEADGSCELEPLGEDFEFIASEDPQVSGAWRAAPSDEEGSGSPVEEVTVETEFASEFVDDSEEDALAADPFAQVQEAVQVSEDPVSQSGSPPAQEDGFPPFFEKWRHDKAGLKKALTIMVKNDLMSPEEARSVFAKASS